MWQLLEHAPEMDESALRRPRIVMLAPDFPMQVTAMAVWLNEIDLDVTLMRFKAYQAADPVMLTVSRSTGFKHCSPRELTGLDREWLARLGQRAEW